MKSAVLLTSCLLFLACPGSAETNDLSIARSALRDGLWEVARTHASGVPGDEARLLTLETFAREEKWNELLAAFDAMGYPAGEGFTYYRALALYRSGSESAASNLLAGVTFADGRYTSAAARLRAAMAEKSGSDAIALQILSRDGGDEVETKLMKASLMRRGGDREKSERLWREVLATTNAAEEARVEAAIELHDVTELRKLLDAAVSGENRRRLALRLGVLELRDPYTRLDGEKRILKCVRESPERAGAREAFHDLAMSRLAAYDATGAAAAFGEALEVWPETAKDPELHDGRARAFAMLGRTDEAVAEFAIAEELYADAELKALVAVRKADALSAAGKSKEATSAYQRLRDAYPGTLAAQRVREVVALREAEEHGRSLYRELKFDEARKVFEDLAEKDAMSRERLEFYGALCSYGSGDDRQAEATVRRLSEASSNLTVKAEASLWLAKFDYNLARWDESRKLFARFAELRPDDPVAPQALVWAARSALAENDFPGVLVIATTLLAKYPNSPHCAGGMLAQGEALIELARFDEAVLVLERSALMDGAEAADRLRARILRADSLFAMGADNPVRYDSALDAYNAVRTAEALSPDDELVISFKIARALEKLHRLDEAIDMYYTQVVLAYRTGRLGGVRYGEAARATFARAAFRLAEEYEVRGRYRQAVHVLDLVRTSDVPAAQEASRRIDELYRKGVL